MNRHSARFFSYSFAVLATSLAVGSACAPTYKGAGTESVKERAGRCLDAGTDTKVAAWLKGRQVQLCKKCAVDYPTKADGTQGECPSPEKNLQSWQEVYSTEDDLIKATIANEICSLNPFALPFPKHSDSVYVRALGANNYPAPADALCAGNDIVRFDPSKPIGGVPGAAPATGPVVGTPPVTAPVTTAPVTTAPVVAAPTTAPVVAAPTTAPMVTAPTTTAPATGPAGAGWVSVPGIPPKFTFVVKSGVNTYIKSDHRLQASQLSEAQKCLLKSNESVPVSAYSTSSSGGRNITVTLGQAKCGFAAGASAFLYADHFQTLPAGLFK